MAPKTRLSDRTFRLYVWGAAIGGSVLTWTAILSAVL